MQEKNIKYLSTFVLLGISMACSGPELLTGSGPSESEARTAIEKATIANIGAAPPSYPYAGREQVKLTSFKIIRRGDYNEAGKYYPIQARQEGSHVEKSIDGGSVTGLGPRTCTFSGSGDFRLAKGDYDEWTAQPVANAELNKDFKMTCDK